MNSGSAVEAISCAGPAAVEGAATSFDSGGDACAGSAGPSSPLAGPDMVSGTIAGAAFGDNCGASSAAHAMTSSVGATGTMPSAAGMSNSLAVGSSAGIVCAVTASGSVAAGGFERRSIR